MTIKLKRVYEAPARTDGRRVLVDRIWPRGVSKKAAELDLWLKDVAPSDRLRKGFAHDAERWEEFKRRYFEELEGKPESLEELQEAASRGPVTLLFAARDEERNNAVALKEYLEGEFGIGDR